MRVSLGVWGLALAGCMGACSSSDAQKPQADGGPQDSGGAPASGGSSSGGQQGSSGSSGGKSSSGGAGGGTPTGGGSSSGGRASGGASGSGGTTGSGGGSSTGGKSSTSTDGWLYTKGNQVYVGGNDAAPWVGRGVNIDDIFFCGYNGSLWMESPGDTFKTMIAGLMTAWKPTFLRVSLGMASFTQVSWLSNPSQYRTPMVDAIKSVGTFPGTYALVLVRSDESMIGQDEQHGNPEATGIPSDGTTSPDRNAFPSGTDDVYEALVNDFRDSPFVLFGITNEPGGNLRSDASLASAMSHAVSVIRAEEDRLGTPHHVIAVQGNSWTSDIDYYAEHPIQSDNIVYEVHGYPPSTESYTFANLPVIIGEYGSLPGNGQAFFADLEAKHIPNLAWDFQPFSNCAPDLVDVTHSATNLVPNDWGRVVQAYLLSHAN